MLYGPRSDGCSMRAKFWFAFLHKNDPLAPHAHHDAVLNMSFGRRRTKRRTKGAGCGEVFVSRRLGGNVVECVLVRQSGDGQCRGRAPLSSPECGRRLVSQVLLRPMACPDLPGAIGRCLHEVEKTGTGSPSRRSMTRGHVSGRPRCVSTEAYRRFDLAAVGACAGQERLSTDWQCVGSRDQAS